MPPDRYHACEGRARLANILPLSLRVEFDMNNVFKTPGVAHSFYEGLRRSGVPE